VRINTKTYLEKRLDHYFSLAYPSGEVTGIQKEQLSAAFFAGVLETQNYMNRNIDQEIDDFAKDIGIDIGRLKKTK